MRCFVFALFMFGAGPAAAHTLICGGTVSPTLAYPNAAGAWGGQEVDLCHQFAQRLGDKFTFTPILQDTDAPPPSALPTVLFLPQGDIPPGYTPGPVIANDEQAIMVPYGSPARSAKDLATSEICVEPGSPEDFNLTAYFAAHHIPLHEFVFQETDELHDAYVAGRCDAITARKSILIGLRANEDGDRQGDIILPDNLGDNPIRAAIPAGQPRWAAIVDKIIEDNRHAS